MVLPQVGVLGMASGRERALRLHQGDPPPALVLEILSFGGTQRDLEHKRRLYANLGIREYLVYDLGGKRRQGSSRELLLFRLENETYRQAEPESKETNTGPDKYWSDVFGAYIRMMPDPREEFSEEPEERRPPPRFQWWDSERNCWRDHETDEEVEQDRVVQERNRALQERNRAVQERMDIAVAMMRSLLSRQLTPANLNRVEEVWRRDGPPTDAVDRILNVQDAPNTWCSLLLPGENQG